MIGRDVIEVLTYGVAITIIRPSGNITGEYALIKTNKQVTKPFIREFFQEATLAHDTAVVPGDVIWASDGRFLLVMNKTPKVMENAVYQHDCVLYKANVAGTIKRPSQGPRSADYTTPTVWTDIKTQAHGLMTESLYGNELDDDEAVGDIVRAAQDLYAPAAYGLAVGDQYWLSATEYYRVEHIKTRRYDNVVIAVLGNDTRA